MNESYNGSMVPARGDTFSVEGVEFAVADGEPKARDVDVAARLGYVHPRHIRKLIERHREALGHLDVRSTVERTLMPRGGARETVVDVHWLTEEQALFIAAKSGTSEATALLKSIIHVFMLARRGLLSATSSPVVANVPPEWTEDGMRLRRAELARAAADVCGPFVSPEVRAVIMAHGTAPLLGLPVEKMLPALPEGEWLRPTQIAALAGVSAHAVGRAITALGLRGDPEHCKTIMDEKKGSAGQVPCYLYDETAVGRIRTHLATKAA